MMKAEELRKKSAEDLDKELVELRKAQFNARMQVSTQQSNKTDQLGKLKKDIARVKNIISENARESL